MYILTWEASVAQGTHIYSRRLPALRRFLPENQIYALKIDPLNLESKTQGKNIPVGLPNSQIKILGK